MSQLTLQIVTPEREILSRDVDEVVLPSKNGSMGVLPGHAPLMALLDVGVVEYRTGSERKRLACCGGFAEVLSSGVKILANTCEPAEDIDVDRARKSKSRGEEEMKAAEGGKGTESTYNLAVMRVRKAVNRIEVGG